MPEKSGSETSTTSATEKLHFDFLTLFPQTIEIWLTTSIPGRALEKGLFSFQTHQLRDFATDAYRSVDDAPYGGGGGMVLRLEPLVAAVEHIRNLRAPHPVEVLSFSPAGERLSTPLLDSLLGGGPRHFLMVCGHYEGIDQRFIDHWVDREVSLGDFVVTGGELPALALTDALIRFIPGALSTAKASREESHSLIDPADRSRLLEYPHFTRPAEFRGIRVPDVLLSGDHEKISDWRLFEARARTREQASRNKPSHGLK